MAKAKNRTSITERLRKSKSRQTRLDFAHEWAEQWEDDYLDLMTDLKRAVNAGDGQAVVDIFGDLRGLMQPKFNALHRVIDELDAPTRELDD